MIIDCVPKRFFFQFYSYSSMFWLAACFLPGYLGFKPLNIKICKILFSPAYIFTVHQSKYKIIKIYTVRERFCYFVLVIIIMYIITSLGFWKYSMTNSLGSSHCEIKHITRRDSGSCRITKVSNKYMKCGVLLTQVFWVRE